MRVLHLTTEFPWPPKSGGSVRTVSQLRVLASLPEVESITMLSVAEEPVSEADLRGLSGAIPKLRVLPPVFHPVHLFDFKRYVPRVVLLRAVGGVPYLAGKWDSRAVRKLLVRNLRDAAVDVVYVDHLGMARYLKDIRTERPRARIVLDQHNVESDFFRQFASRQSGPKKIVARAEHMASVRFEKHALRAADSVVAISDEDARHFSELADVRAEVVPMVMEFERRSRPRPSAPNLCYVGNLRWHPNVAGLDWICQHVWPKVRAAVPDATLEVAGLGLPTEPSGAPVVPPLWRVPGVRVLGFVEDLEPLYARSIGMVAPVFGGSGVRVKMLEGFRAGMPVVTTPDGAFGLPLEDGREALIAADPEAYAARIVDLLRKEDLCCHLREGGYRYLDAHHGLPVAQAVMRRVLGVG